MLERKTTERSKEDYLKSIYVIIKKQGACRITDISKNLDVSKSSVSVAVKKLENAGYVIRDDWRILLTNEGEAIAESVYDKGTFLAEWFKSLGVSEKTAEDDACMIEHVLSEESFTKIREFIRNS